MPAKVRKEETQSSVRLERFFTDRTEPREMFRSLYTKACETPRDYHVLSYYGRGGIGKSSLLHHLYGTVMDSASKEHGYAVFYDMDEGTDERRILTRLRNMLVSIYPKQFSFDTFDLCLLRMSALSGESSDLILQENQTIIESNPVLSKVYEGMTFVPGLSFITDLVDSLTKSYHFISDLDEMRRKKIVRKASGIDKMTLQELQQQLHIFFADDLAACTCRLEKPLVVFLDTYERLVSYMSGIGRAGDEDRWLRDDVIQYVPKTVWVIGGRDRLMWAENDENWTDDPDFSDCALETFSKADAIAYMEKAGIGDDALRAGIADLTEGDPLYLDLSLSIYENKISAGLFPEIGDFSNRHDLVSRYLKDMDATHQQMMELLVCLSKWKDEEIPEICKAVMGTYPELVYRTIRNSSLVQVDGNKRLFIAHVVRDAVLDEMNETTKNHIFEHMPGLKTEEIGTYSLDLVSDIETAVGRMMISFDTEYIMEPKVIYAAIETLYRANDYRDIFALLKPVYECESRNGFKHESLLGLLREYIWSLNYLDKNEEFFNSAKHVLDAIDHWSDYRDVSEIYLLTANAYRSSRQYKEAFDLSQQWLEYLKKTDHMGTIEADNAYSMVASACMGLNLYENAVAILEPTERHMTQMIQSGERESSTDYVTMLRNLGCAYRDSGNPEKGLEWLNKSLDEIIKLNDDRTVADTIKVNMALCLRDMKRYEEAASLITEAVADIQKKLGEKHSLVFSGMRLLAGIYDKAGDTVKAAAVRAELEKLQNR